MPIGHNQVLLQKATTTLADLQPNGILLPEQEDELFKDIIKTSDLLSSITVKTMNRREWQRHFMSFNNDQVLLSDEENTGFGESDVASPTFRKVSMDAQHFKAEFMVSYQSLLEVVGNKEGFMALVRESLPEQINANLVDVLVNGDTALPLSTKKNRARSKIDGFLKKASAHTYDAESNLLSPTVLDAGHLQMPVQYRKRPGMSVLVPSNVYTLYKGQVAARMTPGGDAALASAAAPPHSGRPVIEEPFLPDDLGSDNDLGECIQTFPENMLVGMFRGTNIQMAEDIRKGQVIMVVRLSFDCTYNVPDAVVKYTNVKARV